MALTTDVHPVLDALTATMMSSGASNLQAAAAQMANASVLQALAEMTAPSPFVVLWQMAKIGRRARAINVIVKMDGKVSTVMFVPQTTPVMP